MKKLSVILSLLLFAAAATAQNPSAYFMEGSTFRSQLNPAFAPLRGYVNIPVLGGLSFSTSGNMAVDKIFFPRDGKLVPLIDSRVSAADALSGLHDNNIFNTGFRTNILGFGAFTRNRKDFWSFDINLRTDLGFNVPYSLFDFIKRGEAGSIRDFGFTLDAYLEAGFNYSFPLLDDKLYVGVRGKFLAGLAHMRMQFDRFDATFDENRWTVEATGRMDAIINGVRTEYTDGPDGKQTFTFDDVDYDAPTKPAGYGFAVDLGATYDILPGLQASLAVNDLGFISYGSSNALSGTTSKDLSFTGVEIVDGAAQPQPDFDFDVVEFDRSTPRSSTRALHASLYAGLEYEMWHHRVGFGLLYSARFLDYKTLHNLTASVNFHPIRWFTLTGSISAVDNRGAAVGLALNLCPRQINFFVGTDMLLTKHTPTFYIPCKQSNMHFTFGMGIPIGKHSHRVQEYIKAKDRL